MFQGQYNQMRINLSLTPTAPLLIRSGRTAASTDPTIPDLECVRTWFNGRRSVYIPGSSLKGVMRSHAERLLTSQQIPITPTFSKKAVRAFKQKTPGDEAFIGTCPLGRTFGTLHVKGRTAVSDLLPGGRANGTQRDKLVEEANRTEQRNQVGIDRLLGSAKRGALFDLEVVVQGRFDGTIRLRNFQLYQLALVLFVLRDLDQGYVQLGSGTTRGNGWVKTHIDSILIESRRGLTPRGKLAGLGMLSPDAGRYQLFDGDEIPLPGGLRVKPRMAWDQVKVPADEVEPLGESLFDKLWPRFLDEAKKRKWRA